MIAPAPARIEALLAMAVAARARRGVRGTARIAVLGEFNSGKTTLVNAMLGADLLPAGIATRTRLPIVARFGSRPSLTLKLADGRRVSLAQETLDGPPAADARQVHYRSPLGSLKRITLVDTPASGLEDLIVDLHTVEACRGADLVVWCTPAMQAWKHSEQVLWLTLPVTLRKRGVLAVTFADQIASQVDLDRLSARLRADAGAFFRDIVVLTDSSPVDSGPSLSGGRDFREKASQR
jgi:hypothetical protein